MSTKQVDRALLVWALAGIALCVAGAALAAEPPPEATALIEQVAADDSAHGGFARLLAWGTGEVRDSVSLSFSWLAYLRADGTLVFACDTRFPSSVTLGLSGVRDEAGNAPAVVARGTETDIVFAPKHALSHCSRRDAERGCVAERVLRRPLREFGLVTGFSVREKARIDEPLS